MGVTISCCSLPEERKTEQDNKTTVFEHTQPIIYTYPAIPQFPRSISGATLRPV